MQNNIRYENDNGFLAPPYSTKASQYARSGAAPVYYPRPFHEQFPSSNSPFPQIPSSGSKPPGYQTKDYPPRNMPTNYQYPPGSGQYPPGSGQYPPVSGQYPPGSDQYPPGSGQYPPGSSQYPAQSDAYQRGPYEYRPDHYPYPPGPEGGYPQGPEGGYPQATFVHNTTKQQQQANEFGSEETATAQPRSSRSYIGAIILSILVIVACGWICGIVALVLAIVAALQNAERSVNVGARQYLRASFACSIVGILTGVLTIVLFCYQYGLIK